MDTNKDYYGILGVQRCASEAEIKHAFRKLAKRYHPDMGTCGDANRFMEINEAYECLSDSTERSIYDRETSGPQPWNRGQQRQVYSAPRQHYTQRPARNYYDQSHNQTPGHGRRSVNTATGQAFYGDPTSYNAREQWKYYSERATSRNVSYTDDAQATSPEEQMYRDAVRREPSSVGARYSLANYLVRSNRSILEAELIFEGLYQEGCNDTTVIYGLGLVKSIIGENQDALRYFRLCLDYDPYHGEAYSRLAYLTYMDNPGQDVQWVADNAPPAARETHHFWLLLGTYCHDTRNYQASINYLTKALEIDSSSARTHTLLANSLWETGNMDEAISHYRQAMLLEPDSLPIAVNYSIRVNERGIRLGTIEIPNPQDVQMIDRTFRLRYEQNAVALVGCEYDDVLLIDVKVLEGAKIDILLMTKYEFDNYTSGLSYRYFTRLSRLGSRQLAGSMSVATAGTYCLIAENSFVTQGGANPDISQSFGSVRVRLQAVVGIPDKGGPGFIGTDGSFRPVANRNMAMRLF